MTNYNANIEDHIRKNWFNDHTYTVKGDDDLLSVTWKEPGTLIYEVNYILSGKNLFISGDIAEAAFTFNKVMKFEELKNISLNDFIKSISAFNGNPWEFNQLDAKEELKEYWLKNELEDDSVDLHQIILSAIYQSSTIEEFKVWLMSIYDRTLIEFEHIIEFENIMEISGFGKRISTKVIGYWVGLQMIGEQMEKKKDQITN